MRANGMNRSDNDADLRRTVLTIRFKKREHEAIANEAWGNRKSMSGWLRDVVIEKLTQEGVKLDMAI